MKTEIKKENERSEKRGFFKRMVDKLDQTMKDKAEKKSSSCCSGQDKGGGKCC